jgi:hypothetical protein
VKKIEASEQSVEALGQAILANVDIDLPDSIDKSFIKFVQSILGLQDLDIQKQVNKLYNDQ